MNWRFTYNLNSWSSLLNFFKKIAITTMILIFIFDIKLHQKLINLLGFVQNQVLSVSANEAYPIKFPVIITEVLPRPESGENEWIELHNISTEKVSLSGWKIYDELASVSLIYTIPSAIWIEPEAYLVIELPGHKLNNGGDGVILFNHLGEKIDYMNYPNSQINKSWSLINNQWIETTPTPGFVNQNSTQGPNPNEGIYINNPTSNQNSIVTQDDINLELRSIIACPPTGESEGLVLFNPTQNNINIEKWQAVNNSGIKRNLSATLLAEKETIITWSGAILKNAGDTLSIINQAGAELFFGEYENCIDNQPLFFINETWQNSKNQEGSTPASISIHSPEDSMLTSTQSDKDKQTQDQESKTNSQHSHDLTSFNANSQTSTNRSNPPSVRQQLSTIFKTYQPDYFSLTYLHSLSDLSSSARSLDNLKNNSAKHPESSSMKINYSDKSGSTIRILSNTKKQVFSLFAIIIGGIITTFASYQLYANSNEYD